MYIPTDLVQRFQNDPMAKKASLWGFMIFGIVLMMCAPLDVLSQYPFLAVVVDFVSGLIPSINKWAIHSSWPEVTRLFFTYCWLTIPVQMVIMSIHKPSEERFVNSWIKYAQFYKPALLYIMSLIFRPLLLFFMSALLLLFNYYFAIPYTESSISFDVNAYRSKLVQALYGVIAAYSISGAMACIVWWSKNLKLIYFNKNKGV